VRYAPKAAAVGAALYAACRIHGVPRAMKEVFDAATTGGSEERRRLRRAAGKIFRRLFDYWIISAKLEGAGAGAGTEAGAGGSSSRSWNGNGDGSGCGNEYENEGRGRNRNRNRGRDRNGNGSKPGGTIATITISNPAEQAKAYAARICGEIGADGKVLTKSLEILKALRERNLTSGRSPKVLAAASVYAACKDARFSSTRGSTSGSGIRSRSECRSGG